MGGVDVPGTPVSVVVTVGASTEGALSPEWCGLPVVIVVAKDLILYLIIQGVLNSYVHTGAILN